MTVSRLVSLEVTQAKICQLEDTLFGPLGIEIENKNVLWLEILVPTLFSVISLSVGREIQSRASYPPKKDLSLTLQFAQ